MAFHQRILMQQSVVDLIGAANSSAMQMALLQDGADWFMGFIFLSFSAHMHGSYGSFSLVQSSWTVSVTTMCGLEHISIQAMATGLASSIQISQRS